MSLTTRLDKLEAAMRGRDPPNGSWICRRLIYDPLEWACEEDEAISRMQAYELDRLVAAGEIGETDRGRVAFIIRAIVDPPERPDDPCLRTQREGASSFSTRLHSPNVR
jgi:hypothetical protein